MEDIIERNFLIRKGIMEGITWLGKVYWKDLPDYERYNERNYLIRKGIMKGITWIGKV